MSKRTLQKTVIIILFLVFGLQTIVAQGTIKSPALKTLIQQIDEYYVAAGWGNNFIMEKLAINYPRVYFTYLGAAMNKQANYINNQIESDNFRKLNQEIISLLPDFINVTSLNKKPTNIKELESIYRKAIIGDINKEFNELYKNVTGKELSIINMPSVLDQRSFSNITKASISNQPPENENEQKADIKRPSCLKISSLFYEPNPLLANNAFDFVCNFKADIPEMGNETIPVIFYFKVYVDSKEVFTSEEYIAEVRNNTNKKWIQHMNPFSKTGIYKFETFIRFNNLSDFKSIDVKVE